MSRQMRVSKILYVYRFQVRTTAANPMFLRAERIQLVHFSDNDMKHATMESATNITPTAQPTVSSLFNAVYNRKLVQAFYLSMIRNGKQYKQQQLIDGKSEMFRTLLWCSSGIAYV